MSEKIIGYKVMSIDKENRLCSLASKDYKFKTKIGDEIKMDGQGVWLSTNKDFVIDYYTNPDEDNEVLVTLEFNKSDVTAGNLEDREPVITVPSVVVKNVQRVSNGELNEIKDFGVGLDKKQKKVPSRNRPKS
jgi:hypothetical protein